jgi:uncharacterized protein with FMN-binding domain
MHRAPIVLSATVAGVAATLGFHAHKPAAAVSAAPATTTTTTSRSSSTSTSSSTTKSVTSDAVSTPYGPVQLRVTVAGGRITKIEPLVLPSDDPKSVAIASYAEPLLRRSALAKQSANVDVVSGATFTSNGYATALQSALDKAGVQGAASSGGSAA